jgi:hypothetical protein
MLVTLSEIIFEKEVSKSDLVVEDETICEQYLPTK